MSFYSRGTPYLLAHANGLLQFRIRIPADIQPCLGQREYRRSLGRGYVSEVKPVILRLAAAAHEVFSFAREALEARERTMDCQGLTSITGQGKESPPLADMYTRHTEDSEKSPVTQGNDDHHYTYTSPHLRGRTLASLTDDEIREIAENWLLKALQKANSFNLISASSMPGTRPKDSEDTREFYHENRLATVQGIKAFWQKVLRQRDMGKVQPEVDKLLTIHEIIPTESKEALPYLKACQEVAKARLALYEVQEQSHQGDYKAHDAEIQRLEERREKRRIRVDGPSSPPPSPTLQSASLRTATSPVAQAAVPASVYKLSQALADFKDDQVRGGEWSEQTRHKENDKYVLFQAIVDPDDTLPASALGAEHLRLYKRTLYGIPVNRNTGVTHRDIPEAELLQMAREGKIPEKDRLASGTLRVHADRVNTFIRWLATNQYHSNLAIAGLLKVAKDKQDHERRSPFSPDDITKLFNPELYHRAGLKHAIRRTARAKLADLPDSGGAPSRFWIPLLGLFTGARLEELAQLHLDDLKVADRSDNPPQPVFIPGQPIWKGDALKELLQQAEEGAVTLCLYINEDKEGAHIKNDSSRRYVPLSRILTHELGFLDYAAEVFRVNEETRTEGGGVGGRGRLFPELIKISGRFSHKLSQWFNQTYRPRAGVTDKGKTFHSFRHTIGHFGDSNLLPEKAVGRYLGHSHESITYGTYSKDTAPHILYETVTVPFTEYARSFLDVEGLKASKWAGRG